MQEYGQILPFSWSEQRITCYIVSVTLRNLPDPLTISISNPHDTSPERFIDNLIHELIHRFLNQKTNLEKTKKGMDLIRKKYSQEDEMTKTHIITFAVLRHLLNKFFGENRVKNEVLMSSKYKQFTSYKLA